VGQDAPRGKIEMQLPEKLYPSEEQIDDVAYVWRTIAESRIRLAVRLHKLKNARTRLRVIPWPHVAAYNRFIRDLMGERIDDGLRLKIIRTKEQIIRKLWEISSCIPSDALLDLSYHPAPPPDRFSWALEFILSHLEVGSHATHTRLFMQPMGTPRFETWQSFSLPQTLDEPCSGSEQGRPTPGTPATPCGMPGPLTGGDGGNG